ncbi:MAG: hypothetical protein V1810_03710 [Candidatus Beckwithbacteria bacterium]
MNLREVFIPAEVKPGEEIKAFQLELNKWSFGGTNFSEYSIGKIRWLDYFRFLSEKGLLTDQDGQGFQEYKPITGINFVYSGGPLKLAVGMGDGSVTIFNERTSENSPSFCAWPAAYLLERHLRDKKTSLTELTKLGKWFVEISKINYQGKEFRAGAYLWQGEKGELRIMATGARLEELAFIGDWKRPDFKLDFGIRMD